MRESIIAAIIVFAAMWIWFIYEAKKSPNEE
jgi:hypothetical protein